MDDAIDAARNKLIQTGTDTMLEGPPLKPSYREPRPLYERYTEYGEPSYDPSFERMVRLTEMMKRLSRREGE